MTGRLLVPPTIAGLLVLVLSVSIPSPAYPDSDDRAKVEDEYIRLRALNAVLRARLSLSNEAVPYLILDIPDRQVLLELKGVTLTSVPIQRVTTNKLATEISGDTTRIAFCEVPFILQQDQWHEEVPTLALKDSSAVMSRPDTTGALVERIRTASVLSVLHFERNLVVVLNGSIPPASRIERWKLTARSLWRSMRSGTPEAELRRLRRESILIEANMEPAAVRSLAPTLTGGTKLVLRF